jgi:hypothetical protein
VLQVGLDEAIKRASTDPTRTLSKDPALLTALEKSIDWGGLPGDAIRITTDGVSADEVAARVFAATLP